MAYADIEDVRDEGLPDTDGGGPSDTQVAKWLIAAQDLVDRVTRNHFEEISGTFIFDGTNSQYLHLPLPIVTVSSLKVNNETTALDTNLYRVYNGRTALQDDRKNPKIELRTRDRVTTSAVLPLTSSTVFRKGWDQEIIGTWGYTEADGSVPALITRCTVAIVMTMAEQLYLRYNGAKAGGVGPVIREKTDGHELQFGSNVRDVGSYVLPVDIENKLMLFRKPMKIVIPSVRWSDLGWHRLFAEGRHSAHNP